MCRGPPHWHTVIRYDPHRTPICSSRTSQSSHRRSHDTTSASAVRTGEVISLIFRDAAIELNSKEIYTHAHAHTHSYTRVHTGRCSACLRTIANCKILKRKNERIAHPRVVVACRLTESSSARTRWRETRRQFYSPPYYLSLLHRNGLTIIACFHSRKRAASLCFVRGGNHNKTRKNPRHPS